MNFISFLLRLVCAPPPPSAGDVLELKDIKLVILRQRKREIVAGSTPYVLAGPAAERPIISGKPPTQRRAASSVAQHAREGAKQKPRQGDGAKGAPCIGACRVATPGKPIETLSRSVAQRRGDSQRSIKSRRTLPRGNTTPETNRDPHRAPIPLVKCSCFGPAHEKAPPGLAGLRSSKRGLAEMRVNGKPAETIAQSVAQRAGELAEKTPPRSGANISQP